LIVTRAGHRQCKECKRNWMRAHHRKVTK
jgi:hypothetical protein